MEHTATGKLFGNLSPLWPDLSIEAFDRLLFLKAEGRLVENWIDMIVPSLSALFSSPTPQSRSNDNPLLGT